jgi:hypothetical protein
MSSALQHVLALLWPLLVALLLGFVVHRLLLAAARRARRTHSTCGRG